MLETDRLILRELVESDFDAVHSYATDAKVVWYMPWGPSTESETRDFLNRAQAAAALEPRVGYELAVIRQNDSRLLGAIGLHLNAPNGAVAMLGYCYHRDAWGQGYATEAGSAVVRLGFEKLKVHRIWAGCDPDNTASVRVLKKIGMKLEGHLRQDTRIRNQWRDTLVFGILEQEWCSDA